MRASVGTHAAVARRTGPDRPLRGREAAQSRGCRLERRERPAHQPDLWHVFRVLCDSPSPPSSGHQAQLHRSRRHARAAENVWQPCRASGCRSDPCLAPRSRALAAYVYIVAVGPQRRPPCTSLRRPGTPQERSLPIPGVCQHRTCDVWPFTADLDDFGRCTRSCPLAGRFAAVCYAALRDGRNVGKFFSRHFHVAHDVTRCATLLFTSPNVRTQMQMDNAGAPRRAPEPNLMSDMSM